MCHIVTIDLFDMSLQLPRLGAQLKTFGPGVDAIQPI